MAQAETSAPLKKESIGAVKETVEIEGESVEKGSNEYIALSQEFDAGKKYMFELAERSLERELPTIDMVSKRAITHKPFKPFQNIVFTSQIVWKGQRRMLRYYDGCTTIFQDKQPKDKETIDQLISGTNRDKYNFLEGKFGCYGDEKMLLLYMNICSWNGESVFKTRTSDTIFIPVNADKKATEESSRLDRIETALQYAREATTNKMLIHANYIGIPIVDNDSGNELSEKEIRTAYRKEASRNPENFIESYGNQSIEVKYYIDKALQSGSISNRFNPNKATWANSNAVICDISGLKSQEAISTRLFEFGQSEEGEEFLIQLKSLYNN